jgi:hypothetical protein
MAIEVEYVRRLAVTISKYLQTFVQRVRRKVPKTRTVTLGN